VNAHCPERGDDRLRVDWIPSSDDGPARGEYRLWCPAGGAESFVLVSNRRAP
jgi:hypothetical protein